MALELIYTSAPRGLRPGSKGFCTVAMSTGMAADLVTRLESLSGYRTVFPPESADAARNPVSWAHWQVTATSRVWHVLSRVGFAGFDYSQRSNKLAHHIVLERSELPAAGPAWLMTQPGVFESVWTSEPRLLTVPRELPAAQRPPGLCKLWRDMTGDAGWGAVPANNFLNNSRLPVVVVYQPGQPVLELLEESLALLPPDQRWQVTFNTYFTELPIGLTCAWRCVIAGSDAAKAAMTSRNAAVIDLTGALADAPEGVLTETARTGRQVAIPAANAGEIRLRTPERAATATAVSGGGFGGDGEIPLELDAPDGPEEVSGFLFDNGRTGREGRARRGGVPVWAVVVISLFSLAVGTAGGFFLSRTTGGRAPGTETGTGGPEAKAGGTAKAGAGIGGRKAAAPPANNRKRPASNTSHPPVARHIRENGPGNSANNPARSARHVGPAVPAAVKQGKRTPEKETAAAHSRKTNAHAEATRPAVVKRPVRTGPVSSGKKPAAVAPPEDQREQRHSGHKTLKMPGPRHLLTVGFIKRRPATQGWVVAGAGALDLRFRKPTGWNAPFTARRTGETITFTANKTGALGRKSPPFAKLSLKAQNATWRWLTKPPAHSQKYLGYCMIQLAAAGKRVPAIALAFRPAPANTRARRFRLPPLPTGLTYLVFPKVVVMVGPHGSPERVGHADRRLIWKASIMGKEVPLFHLNVKLSYQRRFASVKLRSNRSRQWQRLRSSLHTEWQKLQSIDGPLNHLRRLHSKNVTLSHKQLQQWASLKRSQTRRRAEVKKQKPKLRDITDAPGAKFAIAIRGSDLPVEYVTYVPSSFAARPSHRRRRR